MLYLQHYHAESYNIVMTMSYVIFVALSRWEL